MAINFEDKMLYVFKKKLNKGLDYFYFDEMDYFIEYKIKAICETFIEVKKDLKKKYIKGEIKDFYLKLNNEYENFKSKISNIDESFFDSYYYVEDMDSAYEHHYDIGKEFLNDINKSTFIGEHFVAYTFNKNYKKQLKNKDNIIVSHKIPGFDDRTINLNNDFKVDINTNFGYGSSSYFSILLYYKEIPLIPYEQYIFFRYAAAFLLQYSTYRSRLKRDNEVWKEAFFAMASDINYFIQEGGEGAIKEYVKNSVRNLFELLEFVLSKDTFFFTDINRVNTLISYKEKKLTYYSDVLINNVNPNAIRLDQLDFFLEKVKEKNYVLEYNDDFKEIIQEIVPEYIKNSGEDVKQKYAYVLAVLISNKINPNSDFVIDGDYNSYLYDKGNGNKIDFKKLVDKIIPDNNLIAYKYSGYNLLEFRNEKLTLSLKLLENIFKIDFINTIQYKKNMIKFIDQISNNNIKFISDEEKSIKELEVKIKIIENEINDLIEKCDYCKLHNKFKNLFEKIISLFYKFNYSKKIIISNDYTFDNFLTEVNEIRKIFNEIINVYGKNFDSLTEISGYESKTLTFFSNPRKYREEYQNNKTEKNRENLIISIENIKFVNDIIKIILSNKERKQEIVDKINERISKIDKNLETLLSRYSYKLDIAVGIYTSFSLFIEVYKENNLFYKENSEKYELFYNENIEEKENEFKKLKKTRDIKISQVENIKKFQKIIDEFNKGGILK